MHDEEIEDIETLPNSDFIDVDEEEEDEIETVCQWQETRDMSDTERRRETH